MRNGDEGEEEEKEREGDEEDEEARGGVGGGDEDGVSLGFQRECGAKQKSGEHRDSEGNKNKKIRKKIPP